MTPFSFPDFASMVLVFVGIPTLLASSVIRSTLRDEMRAVPGEVPRASGSGWGRRSSGSTVTGAAAFVLGFVACAGWLSWSADARGEVLGPGLPAPTAFPTWRIWACGITTVLVCFAAAELARWPKAGGLSAAAGTAAGFTTAFCVSASMDPTGQSGVGAVISEVGWGLGLGAMMWLRGVVLDRRVTPT